MFRAGRLCWPLDLVKLFLQLHLQAFVFGTVSEELKHHCLQAFQKDCCKAFKNAHSAEQSFQAQNEHLLNTPGMKAVVATLNGHQVGRLCCAQLKLLGFAPKSELFAIADVVFDCCSIVMAYCRRAMMQSAARSCELRRLSSPC